MTSYPKYPSGNFSVEVCFPGDVPNTIVDYVDTLEEARSQIKGLVTRPDVCRAVAVPMPDLKADWGRTYMINPANCTKCGKDNCVGIIA